MQETEIQTTEEVKEETTFELDASEEQLLEEFGVLAYAEYGYMI